MTTETTSRNEERAIAYHAYHVVKAARRGQKDRWVRMGAFFLHEDGQGGNLVLDTLPIAFDGRIVLRAPKSEDETGGAQ